MALVVSMLIVCLVSDGCRKPENHDLTVWCIPTTNGVSFNIGYTPISRRELDIITQKATRDFGDTGLIVCLSPGLSISNSFSTLMMAEKYGITNVMVKLNQTRRTPIQKEEDGLIYDSTTKDASDTQSQTVGKE